MLPRSWFVLASTWLAALPLHASAQQTPETPPSFEYRAPPEKFGDETVWKANVQAGFLFVSGNAESIGGSFNGLVAYRHKFDQLELVVRTAYAYSGVAAVTGGPITSHVTSAENWLARLRYDRFLDEQNSIYVAYQMNGDRLAGIAYRIEPQVGFAHRFITEKQQTLRGEVGLDYMYERYLAGTVPIDDSFYSVRLYGFYENKLNAAASFSQSLELLEAVNVPKHFLLNSVTSFTSNITTVWALKVSYILHLNFDPPNRPPPNVGQFGIYDGTLELVLALTIG